VGLGVAGASAFVMWACGGVGRLSTGGRVRPTSLAPQGALIMLPSPINNFPFLPSRRAPSEPEFRGRFKVIGIVKNLEALDLPGFISTYNGKPVLITRSGTLHVGDGYAEMDIRVHR
jgi:hypothetical protein